MSRTLCESLAARERAGRTIGIKVRLDDFTTITRARTLAQPTCDAETVVSVATALLREYAPPRPVRLLGVRVAGLQSTAGESAQGRREQDAGRASPGSQAQLSLPVAC